MLIEMVKLIAYSYGCIYAVLGYVRVLGVCCLNRVERGYKRVEHYAWGMHYPTRACALACTQTGLAWVAVSKLSVMLHQRNRGDILGIKSKVPMIESPLPITPPPFNSHPHFQIPILKKKIKEFYKRSINMSQQSIVQNCWIFTTEYFPQIKSLRLRKVCFKVCAWLLQRY